MTLRLLYCGWHVSPIAGVDTGTGRQAFLGAWQRYRVARLGAGVADIGF